MTGLMIGLAVLASLASFVFFIWLAVIAFKQGVGWGLAVLFLPFGVLFFAVKHWSDVKKPFLLHVGTGVASGLFMFIGAAAMTNAAMAQMNDPEFQAQLQAAMEEQVNEAEAEGEMNFETPETPAFEIDETTGVTNLAPRSTPPSIGPSSPSSIPQLSLPTLNDEPIAAARPKSVGASNAERYVGSNVRIVGHKGMETVAKLVSVKRGRLYLERDLSGGTAEFSVPRSDIKALYVMPPR